MFVVRLIVLVFLNAYSWSMGQIPPDGLNDFGKLVAMSFFIVAPALYMLPTYEAWKNEQPNLVPIALVNFFLGWSLLGWVVAAAWAFKKQEGAVASTATAEAAQDKTTVKCPFCAEDVLAAAVKCKHCGSSLPSAPAAAPSAPILNHPDPSGDEVMEQYGITFRDGKYQFQSYRYDNLSDAINYAKRQST